MEEDNENNEEIVEVEKTYSQEEVDKIKEEMKAEFEGSFDKKFSKKLGKELAKMERDNAKKDELINLIKEQTGAGTMDELLDLSYKQYEVERPTSTKDDEILGKHDAQELLELDDYDEIEAEANRLARSNRSVREDAMFRELGTYLTNKKTELKRKNEILQAGLDESIMQDKGFTDFLGKFNEGTSISEAYDLYQKVNPKKEPFNTGSLKDDKATNETPYFSKDEFMALTDEDLKNPQIFKKAMESKNFF